LLLQLWNSIAVQSILNILQEQFSRLLQYRSRWCLSTPELCFGPVQKNLSMVRAANHTIMSRPLHTLRVNTIDLLRLTWIYFYPGKVADITRLATKHQKSKGKNEHLSISRLCVYNA